MADATTPQQQYSQPPRRRKWPRRLGLLVAFAVVLGIGIAIGNGTKTATTTTKTVTKTVYVATPSPSPVTVTVTPPPPPTGSTIATFHGSGNQNTSTFTVPSSGDYVVSWSYSGNNSSGIGGDNFAISETSGGGFGDLPNDIATSGHGSTEVTGASGTDSFNVESDSTCNWTITVKSAP